MLLNRCFVVATAAALLPAALAAPAFAQTSAQELLALEADKLVEILENPEAPVFDKAKACQRLAVIGTKDAVPALAASLADETLNVYARSGLEGIPDPAADEALRDAATRLQGRPLAGVIDSIGRRRDVVAVGLLQGFLANEDTAVLSAAAGSLGQIGTSEAADALKEALAKKSSAKSAVAEACLACADELAATGNKAEAVALYQAVAQAHLPAHLRVDALQGQFRLLKAEAKDLLVEQIRSEDQAFFNLGLAAARQMPGAEVTEALAGELEKLPPERQALLLLALGDRDDPVPLPLVLAASKSDYASVREAAIPVLARSGDPSAMAILVDAALGDGELARKAQERLKTLPGHDVDAIIVARLTDADGMAKIALFDLVGARRIVDAAPAVESALSDANLEVQAAAVAALGQLIELDDLDLLIGRALAESAPDVATAARAALKTAALRMNDREACAAQLAAKLVGASLENQVYLLELLGKLSGQQALETVVAHVKSDDPAVKDAATRVLGEWVNADAAPELLEIAKNDSEAKYRVRALRGYLRTARQLQLPAEARLAMFRTALEFAERDEEKQLAMDVLTRIPSVETLSLAVSYLGQPALKNAAAEAAVKIAPKLIGSEPKAVAEAMRKVVAAGVEGNAGTRAQQLLEQADGSPR